MELRQLRYFAAVAEAGSFTAAATVLHLSQPPLSVAIGKLESELGVRLLERSSRGVEPTSAGRHLLDGATRIFGELDTLISTMKGYADGTAGTLTIAAVPVLMWHRLPFLLRAHAAASPDVEIRLVDPPPWEAIELLQQRRVDAAAVVVADHQRFNARHGDVLDIVDWGEIPLVAVLPPEASETPDPMPLSSFEGSRLLLPRRTAAVPSLPEAVEAVLALHGVTPGTIRTVETIQAGLPFIEAGTAEAILPDPDHASLRRFNVTVRRLDPEPPPLRALLLTRRGGLRNPHLHQLMKTAGLSPHPV